MKLLYNQASPFARKVIVCIHELGLVDRVEVVTTTVSPVAPDAGVNAANALGKIPTLVLDDGTGVFDSRVICEYLDTLSDSSMFPAQGDALLKAQRLHAFGDGICDTGVQLRYETFLRPEELRWPEWISSQKERLHRTFQQIEDKFLADLEGVHIGSIAVASAIGYMDFRMTDLGWRHGRPGLSAWYDSFIARPSMVATKPD